jgi:hypothetical protein
MTIADRIAQEFIHELCRRIPVLRDMPSWQLDLFVHDIQLEFAARIEGEVDDACMNAYRDGADGRALDGDWP